MAEEQEVEYSISFDEADLTQKLDRIRSQIDMALGGNAMESTAMPLAADLTAFASGQVGAAAMGTNQPQFAPNLPSNFGQQQDQSF